jgi:hypothetical protein
MLIKIRDCILLCEMLLSECLYNTSSVPEGEEQSGMLFVWKGLNFPTA